jgi:F-type H+-transporting ATPase subunit delta
MNGSLAKRYARALIELASTPMQRDRYLKDLETLSAAVSISTDEGPLGAFLDAGHLSLKKRLGISRAVCQRAGADATVTKFMDLLVERGRVAGLVLIARHFRDLADEASGRVRANVKSAQPLTPDATSKIKTALAKATGKQVILETEVDAALIGGIVTTVGSYTLDRSVRASLARLRTNLHNA